MFRTTRAVARAAVITLMLASLAVAQAPISVEPLNHQYFTYNNKTLALVGMSGDYLPHVKQTQFPCGLDNYVTACLNRLRDEELNKTQIWLSLNHSPGKFFSGAPWLNEQPFAYLGVDAQGFDHWDLKSYNQTYLTNVFNFIQAASARNITVEVTLFDAWSGDNQNTGPWKHNKQGWRFTDTKFFNSYDNTTNDLTKANSQLRTVQKEFIREIATKLKGLTNFYWEIANEPDLNGQVNVNSSINWHNDMANEIYNVESGVGFQHHLIAADYSYRGAILNAAASPRIDIINTHYTKLNVPAGGTPDTDRLGAIKLIRTYNIFPATPSADKIFGFNEDRPTGPVANNATPEGARAGAWEFMLNEGGTVDHLRYDTGTDYTQVLIQFGFIRRVIGALPLKAMKRPQTQTWMANFPYPSDAPNTTGKFRATMQQDANVYVLYIHHSFLTGSANDKYFPVFGNYQENLQVMNLGAAGCYRYEWYDTTAPNIDPANGRRTPAANILPGGSGTFNWLNAGTQSLPPSPTYSYDVVLKLYRCP